LGWNGWGWFLLCFGFAALFKPIAFVAGFDDVAVVGEAIQEGGGHLGVDEHGDPFREAQVGGDDHAGALVEF